MKWKVIVSAPYIQPVIDRFRDLFNENSIELLIPTVKERLEEDELLEWIKDVDGAICGDDRFTEEILRAAPKLKVISKWGTGIDSIDLEACHKLGIAVHRTPNAFSEAVADTVIGYILCFARNLPFMDRKMHEGIWDKIPGVTLQEGVLGVIGVGDVGKAVIRRAISFGMRVLGNDIVDVSADFLNKSKIEMVSKDELLNQSDFISLNCDLNPTSLHLLDANAFSIMKNNAIIVNTARGPIIDESALIKALREKQIAGAALDVFEIEPLPQDSPLIKMENVMLAPHNANSSPKAWETVHHNTIQNLIKVLKRS